MATRWSEEAAKAVRARGKLYTRARSVSQTVFFVLTGIIGYTIFLTTPNWITALRTIVLWIVVPMLIITAYMGRFWCGWFCPVGAILDFVGTVFKRTCKNPKKRYARYARFWCRLCPPGLFLGLLNRVNFLKLMRDIERCGGAMCPIDFACVNECPMGCDVLDRRWQDPKCIRCNTCIYVCEIGAIRPTCYFSRWMERTCVVWKLKLKVLFSPLGSLYLYLKLKILGFKGVEKYGGDTIFLCTQCNKCRLATLRRTLMKAFVKHEAGPKGISLVRNNILKHGNPYGKPEFRFALLPKTYTNSFSRIFFLGCTSCYRTPELMLSALALLEESKVEFGVMPDEICCGFPLYILGYDREACELVQRNVKMLKEKGVKEIITLCPGCHLAFKTLYKDFQGLNIQVKHILEVLKPKITVTGLSLTVHDPCHLEEEINRIAGEALEGCKVQKSQEPCCGALLLSHHPETGVEIAQRIVEASYTPYITTHCPSCYLILSTVKPDKMIDLYTLLRVRQAEDVKQLKEWVKDLHERARLIRLRRLTPEPVSHPADVRSPPSE